MFRDTIRGTSLTSGKANSYFNGKIRAANCFAEDVSMLSTLRALLYDKLGEDECVILKYRNFTYSSTRDYISRVYAQEMDNTTDGVGCYHFTVYDGHLNYGSEKIFEDFPTEDLERELPEGFHIINKVTELFRKQFIVYCFINENSKNVAILTSDISLKYYHMLQCAIIGMTPWWFSPDNIDEDKMNLIYSLREKSPDKYNAAIDKIAAKINFREGYIKEKLAGFELTFERARVDSVQRNINSKRNNIQDYYDNISNLNRQIRDMEYELAGLMEKLNSPTSGDSEIMEYFLCNKHLDLMEVGVSRFTFAVSGEAIYYDENIAETYIDNLNSCLYYQLPREMSREDFRRVLRAIFIDKEVKMKVCAAYTLNVADMYLSPYSGYGYGSDYNYQMPNPHIDRYNCIGNFAGIFQDCMEKHDYVRGIEQAIVSAQSFNFADTTVMKELMNRLCGNGDVGCQYYTKCLRLPDDTRVDIHGVLEWLKAKDAPQVEEQEVVETVEETEQEAEHE